MVNSNECLHEDFTSNITHVTWNMTKSYDREWNHEIWTQKYDILIILWIFY